jgi:hypothetical protein
MLATSPYPVIAVGDYNSAADGSTTPVYGALLGSGLTDAFGFMNPGEDGFTAGMSNDLLGPVSLFRSRIDLILFRGAVQPVHVFRVGAAESDRTPSGLMPSDHAGVVATLRVGMHRR